MRRLCTRLVVYWRRHMIKLSSCMTRSKVINKIRNEPPSVTNYNKSILNSTRSPFEHRGMIDVQDNSHSTYCSVIS